MLSSSRRALLVLTVVAGLAVATSLPLALAEKQPGTPGITNPTEFSDNISLPTNPAFKKKLIAIGDYINEKNWVVATEAAQSLLDREDDVFVPLSSGKGADGKETIVWRSAKTEANRLIGELPAPGMEFYKLTYGPPASAMLKEALEKGGNDKKSTVELLAEVMARYLHTDAGAEATNLLGTYYLDRGGYITARHCFVRLLERDKPAKLSTMTLFKAAYAFHMADDKANEERVWRELNQRGQHLVLGNERHTVEDLQNAVAALSPKDFVRNQSDWPLFKGTQDRSGKGEGGTPFLEPDWRRPLAEQSTTKGWIEEAFRYVSLKKVPFLPAAFPITATVTKDGRRLPLLIYRSHWGLYAVDVKTGDLKWRAPSAWSMDMMVSKPNKQPALNNWVEYYKNNLKNPTLLFENSTIGTLSTDSTHVYAVEDLAVSPLQNEFDPRFNPGMQVQPHYDPAVADAIRHNRLQAYDLITGKLRWEVGGPPDKGGELDGSFFLGPPMPIGGKLYVLTEKQQDLRLVCLDGARGRVLSVQTLASTKDKMQQEPLRRMHAAHLAYGEGMLVCPTNSGAILGVDQLTRSLVWAYPYREKTGSTPAQDPNVEMGLPPGFRGRRFPPGMMVPTVPTLPHWQVSAPIIQDGKVVFTAPDAKSVHCIRLRDGERVWVLERNADDLYLAGVYNGKVVIVGKRNVRAVSLTKTHVERRGKDDVVVPDPVWNIPDVGLPSGQGVASGSIYYLPLKAAAATNEPEICAIDIDRGIFHAHTKSRKKEVPGNLLFYEGDVVSQTVTEIVAFPQLKVKLAQIDERISKNPNDPVGLTERGELRLDKGDLQGAIDDLALALKNNPPKEIRGKARIKLYETLTELFQRDFDAAEKYLPEYETLCKVDLEGVSSETEKLERQNEARRRRANFLCLVAKGKQAQGKLVEAFERYMEFSALANKDELTSVIDEPTVRAAPDVWSQGRIRAMVASATAEQRKPLEERIAVRWKELQNGSAEKGLDDLRNFVNVFGSMFKVGKEARLHLAERLMDDPDPLSLLEAERHLYLLRGPSEEPAVAARAVECLARLNTRKGMLKDAAYYYRLLRRDFPNVPVSDGKTGSDIFDEQATDKRLLPFMDEPDRLGGGSKRITTSPPEVGNFQYQNQSYQLGQVGEKLPFFQENQLVIRYQQPNSLRMLDRARGDEKWSQPLTHTMFQALVFGNGQNMPKFPFLNLGHLVVLPLGNMVFGIDPINRKLLWEKNLASSSVSTEPGAGPPPNQITQLTVDPRDNSVLILYPDGWTQRLGTTGPLEGNVICLQMRDALIGLDPVTGRTLWTRSDVSPRCHVFGDEQMVYVVDVNESNRATTTKALRAYDGVSVKVPDFAALYDRRVGQSGRILALSEPAASGGTTLRLYDVAAGKDVWKGEFPAGSVLLHSEDPNLAGMVEPDGKVRVVNLQTHKEVLQARGKAEHFAGAQTVTLLADTQDYYLAVNGPPNNNGGFQSTLMGGTGMRAIPVNGMVYCFNGANSKLRWYQDVKNQYLVLEHFRELPFVLFTAKSIQPTQFGGRVWQTSVRSIQKSNGKLVCQADNVPQNVSFYALNVDARAGKVELIGQNWKLTHHLNGDAPGR